ncbi:MAG: hypothetical protein ACKVTZ_17830 [Bacteroidia bacterium]
MNKLILSLTLLLLLGVTGCGPICDLPQKAFYVRLVDAKNHQDLISNGIYDSTAIMIYELYACNSQDSCSEYLIPQGEEIYTTQKNAITVVVRQSEVRKLLVKLTDSDTDTIIFECQKGGKTCIECTGSYNGKMLCTDCEADAVFEIPK